MTSFCLRGASKSAIAQQTLLLGVHLRTWDHQIILLQRWGEVSEASPACLWSNHALWLGSKTKIAFIWRFNELARVHEWAITMLHSRIRSVMRFLLQLMVVPGVTRVVRLAPSTKLILWVNVTSWLVMVQIVYCRFTSCLRSNVAQIVFPYAFSEG